MEKVKLTPEQAEAIEKWKGMANNKQILHAFIGNGKEYGWLDELECLKSLSFEEMALVLCDWYEIEEPYKVGDWLHVTTPNFDFVAKVIGERDEYTEFDNGKKLSAFEFRKATTEEIATEKERRKWAAIGRRVGEFKKGDIVRVVDKGGSNLQVGEIGELGNRCGNAFKVNGRLKTVNWVGGEEGGNFELICPVEHRFDLKEDE